MRPTDDVERQLKQAPIRLNPEADKAVLRDLFDRLGGVKGVQPIYRGTGPRVTKLAVAAALLIATLWGIMELVGFTDGSNVVWAEVVRHIEQVDHLHFYAIATEPNGHLSIREGWYAHGKIRTQQYDAEQTIDNGELYVIVDEHNNVIDKNKSTLKDYDNVYDALTKDTLSYRLSHFDDKTPISIGSDFLIYEFEPPEDKAAWIKKTSITVGRQSLMPVQIKTYNQKKNWSMNHLLVFDYEAPEKPETFFAMPTQAKSPHGIGQVVLGGEEVTIELQNTPGVEKAIVRLHTEDMGATRKKLAKYGWKDQSHGESAAFLEVTFITEENGRTYPEISPLWLDRGFKGIAKLSESEPDNQYRFIIYTSVLKATSESNVFSLELSCWLKTKRLFPN